MSNARNLANLLGTGTTVPTAKIADDAITNAKLSDSDSFTVGGLTVSGATTLQTTTTTTTTTTRKMIILTTIVSCSSPLIS